MSSSYFCSTDTRRKPKHALNPNKCELHEDLYAAVDNTFIEYQNFLKDIEELVPNAERKCFLFHGETGCGKTSLINRCLKSYLDNDWHKDGSKLTSYLFDFTEEKISQYSNSQKIEIIFDLMMGQLVDNPMNKANELEDYTKVAESNMLIKLKYLERKFFKYNHQPIILLPKVELESELSNLIDHFFRANWVLFIETSEPSVLQLAKDSFNSSNDSHVNRYSVGSLEPKDAKPFILSRQNLFKTEIEFNIPDLEKYIQTTNQRPSGPASVLELEIVCKKAYDMAVENKVKNIGFDHLLTAAVIELTK